MPHRDQPPTDDPASASSVAVFPRSAIGPQMGSGQDGYGYGYEEPGTPGGFNVWETIQIIASRKFLIAAILILGVAASAIFTLRATPLYRATATVEFQKTETQILEGASVDPVVVADAEYMATQFALLKSRSLAERVAEILGLPGDPRYAD
ncbi:MAG: Wzz/FepE/Etk N-terminal domain-containing protein, partial [Pseudomonadota bacterium]